MNGSDSIWNDTVLSNSTIKGYDYGHIKLLLDILRVSPWCSLVLSTIGFVLNLANMCVIVYSRSNMFYLKMLVSLSTSDMLLDVSLIILNKPPFATAAIGGCIYILSQLTFTLGTVSELLNFAVIALDHYLLITKPMKHTIWTSKKNSRRVLLLVWGISLTSVAVACLCLVNLDATNPCNLSKYNAMLIPVILGAVTVLCIPIIVYAYIYINIHMWRIRQQRVRSLTLPNSHNKKLLITSLLLLGTFLLCWVPYIVFIPAGRVLSRLRIVSRASSLDLLMATTICGILFALNTVCDPLIYAIRIHQVRDAYKEIWLKMFAFCHRNQS